MSKSRVMGFAAALLATTLSTSVLHAAPKSKTQSQAKLQVKSQVKSQTAAPVAKKTALAPSAAPVSTFLPKFDSSRLKAAGQAAKAVSKVEPPKIGKSPESRPPVPELNEEDESSLNKAVDSLTVLLERVPVGPTRDKLLFTRAQASLSLAQRHMLRKGSLTQAPAAKRFLEYAVSDAENLLKGNPDASLKARALYVSGMASLYLNHSQLTRDRFLRALQIDSKSKEVPWMAFYVADDDFENDRFREAIQFFQKYYPVWDAKSKRMALYKTAWAYINLNQIELAQKSFLQIILQAPDEEIARDSARDLAYFTIKFKGEAASLALANEMSGAQKIQIEFLKSSFSNLCAQAKVGLDSQLFATLLTKETDPAERLKIYLLLLGNANRVYASKLHLVVFQRLEAEIARLDVTPESPLFETVKVGVDSEVQGLMKSYIETLSGRVKSPEGLTPENLRTGLKRLFAFYVKYFPVSPLRPSVFTLWMEVCHDAQDWECVYAVSTHVITKAEDASLKPKAKLERLSALDELQKKNRSKYEDEFKEELKGFVSSEKGSPKWLPLAKRLVEVYSQEKDFSDAISLLEKILAKEPTQETFYRLQWTRFQDSRFEDITREKRGASIPGKPEPKLAEVEREASLNLALKARDRGDVEIYTAGIQKFLVSEPDPAKAAIAKKDYLSFLLEKGAFPEATEAYLKLTPVERASKDYTPFLEGLVVPLMKNGEFHQASVLIQKSVEHPGGDLLYWRTLAALGQGEPVRHEVIADFKPVRRDYLLSLLVLCDPEWAKAYQRRFPPQSESDKAVAQIAAQLTKSESGEPPKSQTELKIAGLPGRAEMLDRALKLPDHQLTKTLQSWIESTRFIRNGIAADLKGKPALLQIRILDGAMGLENAISEVILNSPLPKGLDEAQIQQYKGGIAKMASEFSEQAKELDKIRSALRIPAEQERLAKVDSSLPRPQAIRWPWPSLYREKKLSPLLKLVNTGNKMGALIVADLLRGDPLKDDDDFYPIRAGILLYGSSTAPSRALIRYVTDELKQSKQTDLLESWKKAVES